MTESKGWWDRNWYWVLGAGCLVPILACGGCFGLSALFLKSKIDNFAPYNDAVALAMSHPVVIAELGQPIETGWLTQSQIDISNGSGSAGMYIPLNGPNGSATLRLKATKADGVWSYDKLTVRIDGIEDEIDLLEAEREIEDGAETGSQSGAAQGGIDGQGGGGVIARDPAGDRQLE